MCFPQGWYPRYCHWCDYRDFSVVIFVILWLKLFRRSKILCIIYTSWRIHQGKISILIFISISNYTSCRWNNFYNRGIIDFCDDFVSNYMYILLNNNKSSFPWFLWRWWAKGQQLWPKQKHLFTFFKWKFYFFNYLM